MKVILEFDTPEEQADLLRAFMANDMARDINDLMMKTQGWLKHGHGFKTPDEAIEEIREMMHEAAQIAAGG